MTTNLEGGIFRPANTSLYNESHGVFGELIDPHVVFKALSFSDNVGRLDDPEAAQATQALHSFSCQETSEIVLEFENATRHPLRVRWMDERGKTSLQSEWRLEPFSSSVQLGRPGYLYVLSVDNLPNEELLGAYRTRMVLPSGSPHLILVEEQVSESENLFIVDAVVSDDDDALVVAAESLDPVEAGSKHRNVEKTISALFTIVNNIICHPEEPKYKSLRCSNPKVKSQITSSWGAMEILHILGFHETSDDHLTLASEPNKNLLRSAAKYLDQLQKRSEPGFVAELAENVPWHGPVLTSSFSASTFRTSTGTHFLTADDRWRRSERSASYRRGGHRRPDPGNAPSSRGNWGR